MGKFLDENFLLETGTSRKLYHDFAAGMPIIDYHCHLPVREIAEDIHFRNLTHIWLYGDHYKWRAMRANGVQEPFVTGDRSDLEKFEHWAATVPYTLRNPLYHWTHLELQRYFGVHELLNASSARRIYDTCSELLQTPEYSVRNLLRKMNVKVVCTTDDPVDTLEHHRKIGEGDYEIRVLPAFRPDRAMQVEDVGQFLSYVHELEIITDSSIGSYGQYLGALKQRHDFFATMGCSVSDHGLDFIPAVHYTLADATAIFGKLRSGRELSADEQLRFRSAMLHELAVWDHEKNWVQQFHLGALRNNNRRMLETSGPDTGWDSIGDFPQATALSRFFDRLDTGNQLAKTILYNLNPADNEVFATMAGNFNDGSVPGKMQFGAAWWFLDQKDGMTRQLNALSNMGLLSRFVGMITDSRSFLSYPRHEYFRRLLCNLIGGEMERGELPDDLEWTGSMVRDICYHNACRYFGW